MKECDIILEHLNECAKVRGIKLEELPKWCEEQIGKEYAAKLKRIMCRACSKTKSAARKCQCEDCDKT